MSRFRLATASIALAVTGACVAALPAAAHIVKQVGPYSVALGWLREPTYVGEQNAVQVVIKDAHGNPISDLSPDDLKVVVTTGGRSSDPMSLVATFDEDTGLGIPGDYEAPIVPTAPGPYTFHVTGKIHDTAIDETATSSDTTFESAVSPAAIQFPVKQPDLGEVATRLDRVDARIADARATATDAGSRASQAMVVGLLVGALGVLLGAAGTYLAVTSRRRTQP